MFCPVCALPNEQFEQCRLLGQRKNGQLLRYSGTPPLEPEYWLHEAYVVRFMILDFDSARYHIWHTVAYRSADLARFFVTVDVPAVLRMIFRKPHRRPVAIRPRLFWRPRVDEDRTFLKIGSTFVLFAHLRENGVADRNLEALTKLRLPNSRMKDFSMSPSSHAFIRLTQRCRKRWSNISAPRNSI